jgi:hypothetical protein
MSKLDHTVFIEAAELLFLGDAAPDILEDRFSSRGACRALSGVQTRHAGERYINYSSPEHEFFHNFFPWRVETPEQERVHFGDCVPWNVEHRVQALLLCAAICEDEQKPAKKRGKTK